MVMLTKKGQNITMEKNTNTNTDKFDLNEFVMDSGEVSDVIKKVIGTDGTEAKENENVIKKVNEENGKEGNVVNKDTKGVKEDVKEDDTALDKKIEEIVKKQVETTGKTTEEIIKELDKQLSEQEAKSDLSFKPLYDALEQRLGISIENLEDKPTDDINGFMDFIEKVIEDNSSPSYATEETRKFDEYVKAGYDPKKFLSAVYGSGELDKFSIDTEDGQKEFLRYIYKLKYPTWNSDKVNQRIEKMVEGDLMEDEAKELFNGLKEEEKGKLKLLHSEKDKVDSDRRISYDRTIQNLRNKINGSDKIAGFEINTTEKNSFFKYLTERGSDGRTPYERKLLEPETKYNLAYLAFKNITKDKMKVDITTEQSRRLRKALTRFTDSSIKSGGINVNEGASTVKETNGKMNYEEFIF